jgi:hypothetical protein
MRNNDYIHERPDWPRFHWDQRSLVEKLVRIPVKWSADSGDVGQHRSEATLGCSYLIEVDHLSQESGEMERNHHHFVSLVVAVT